MITKDFFKTRLKELRKESGQTQAQVGIATGIGERNYQRFEAGENFPSVENLCRLADYFEVSLDYLMGRTDQRRVS